MKRLKRGIAFVTAGIIALSCAYVPRANAQEEAGVANDYTTVKEVSEKLSYTNKDMFPAMQAFGGEYNGHYAYCLNHSAQTPGTGGTGYNGGDEMDAHMAYITGNGLVSNSQRGDSRYQTGDWKKDYYITQLAVHVYQDPKQVNFDYITGDADVIRCAENLYNDAMAYNGSSIWVDPRYMDFSYEGDGYFRTGWYNVGIQGNCSSWDVDIQAPFYVNVIKSGNSFRLEVNQNDVTTNCDIQIRVKGYFNNPQSFQYNCVNPSCQSVTIPKSSPLWIPDQDYSTAHLEAYGNIHIDKTCEQFDPITQTSTYTKENAGGRQFQADGNTPSNGYTDSNGNLDFNHVIIGGYNVYEQNTPVQYKQPATQNIRVNVNQTTNVSVQNTLKKGQVGFIKKCTYYGDVRLRGAVYGVYRKSDDALIQKLTSDADYVWSNLLPYGEYYLKEITPPEFYAADDREYPFAITEDGQKVEVVTWNTPLSNVYPEFITPNSDYRQGTDIIASYKIHNDSIAEHAPVRPAHVKPLIVDFEATYKVNGQTKTVSTQQKQVIVPKFSENLVYFNLKVPEDADNLHFKCTVEIDPDVIEPITDNKTVENDFSIKPAPSSTTPDTKFENQPNGYNTPSEDADVDTDDLAKTISDTSSWQMYDWDQSKFEKSKNGFVLNTYGVQLSDTQSMQPDDVVQTAEQTPTGSELKSGYGIRFTSKNSIVQTDDKYPSSDAYTLPQHGISYYPEFEYAYQSNKFEDLALTSADTFEFKQSSYTTQDDGTHDMRRVHFIPIWFPDTGYVLKTYLYDAWTPAGMISQKTTVKGIDIQGDVYDDWYIAHQDKG